MERSTYMEHNAERWIIRDGMPYAVLLLAPHFGEVQRKEGWSGGYFTVLVHDQVWLVRDVLRSRQAAEAAIAKGVKDTERFTLSPEGVQANTRHAEQIVGRLLGGYLEGIR